eukprot:1161565-Pelagomonas_calceolata.AAC.4
MPRFLNSAEPASKLALYPIGKGADIFISVWNLHHSPHLWKDPEEFRPERFTESFENPGFNGAWAGVFGAMGGRGRGGLTMCEPGWVQSNGWLCVGCTLTRVYAKQGLIVCEPGWVQSKGCLRVRQVGCKQGQAV